MEITKAEEKLLEIIRKNDTTWANWLNKHLKEEDGHYIEDECWLQMRKLMGKMVVKCKK